MTIDPELLSHLNQFSPFDLADNTLSEVRKSFNENCCRKSMEQTTYRDVLVEDHIVAGDDFEVRVRVYNSIAASDAAPALLWMHGGGFVLGCLEMDEPIIRRIVHDIGIAIVSVDYRLAPDFPFPAALDDCDAALTWLFDNTARLSIDPRRIGLGGGSAGAGLAAALALRNRDTKKLPIQYQCLIYPMLDHRNGVLDAVSTDRNKVWTRRNNQFAWNAYLNGDLTDSKVSPYASPATGDDLSGLPSAYITVGDQDLFLDEDVDYARRLRNAGVSVELHVVPGGVHSFDKFPVRIADEEIRRRARALSRNLNEPRASATL